MKLNFIEQLGDLNPQLMREIKGRFKFVNIAIATVISLITQLGLCLYQFVNYQENFPVHIYSKYCRVSLTYAHKLDDLYRQSTDLKYQLSTHHDPDKIRVLSEQIDSIQIQINTINQLSSRQACPPDQINIQLWWQEHWEQIFLNLSVIFIFTLLVAGTYLLINDLAKEQNRGTLNFIRLSPQTGTSILIGKLLGVPSLIYLVIGLAIPLHLYAGYSANIAFSDILSFYTVLVASCVFFFSAALMFSLVGSLCGPFQPWLFSGAVLCFLIISSVNITSPAYIKNSLAWFELLSPFRITSYLFPNLVHRTREEIIGNLQFFYLSIGKSTVNIIGFHLCNYVLWTYWIWQGLKRRFDNPNIAIISKIKSYLFVTCVQILVLGFTLQHFASDYDTDYQIFRNFNLIVFCNIGLILGLIPILLPHRQTIQDWARYRYQNKSLGNSIFLDLVMGEKSPGLVALAINLAIITIPLIIWTLLMSDFYNYHHVGKLKIIFGIGLFSTFILICGTIAQKILLTRNNKRSFWAIGVISAVIFLPLLSLNLFKPLSHTMVGLLSVYPWVSLETSTTTTIFLTFLGEFAVLVLLNLNLTRQIKLVGQSATKALLAKS